MIITTIRRENLFPEDLGWRETVAEGLDARGFKTQSIRFCDCHRKLLRLPCLDWTHNLINLLVSFRCEYRICPVCGGERRYKVKQKLNQIFKQLPQIRGHRLMFLTLTKRARYGEGELKEGIRNFLAQVRVFMNQFSPSRQKSGAIVVLEIGPNFNLHVHCIVFGPYIPQEVLSRAWEQISTDSFIVDIREVRKLRGAVSYLLKYVTKPPHFTDPDNYVTMFVELYRVRAMRTYGIFYNFKVSKQDSGCPICGGKFRFMGYRTAIGLEENLTTYLELVELMKPLKTAGLI